MMECKQKTQKQYYVRFKRIKGLSLMGVGRVICAKSRASAKAKFRKTFPVRPVPIVTGVTEVGKMK